MITFAGLDDIPALKKIWSECFGDPEDYISFYFANGFKPENTLVYRENGKPCAMVTLLPGSLKTADKKENFPVYYIYAAATLPENQGRGIMKQLLSFAESHAKSRGVQALTLVPGSASLFEYYGNLGYTTEFFYKKVELSVKELEEIPTFPVRDQLTGGQFYQMRKEFLSGLPASFFWGREELAYVLKETEKTGGKILNFYHNGLQGYAVCYKIEHDMMIKEIGTSREMLLPFLSGIHRYFHTDKYTVRLSVPDGVCFSQGQIVPFGMIKRLNPSVPVFSMDFSSAYMGLMLD